MTLFDLIKNWRLNRKIPENQKGKSRFRYSGNGIDKIYLDDQQEVKMYNYARDQEKKRDEF